VDFKDDSYNSLTLLQALELKGGDQNALIRARVASLLNSAKNSDAQVTNFSLTPTQVYDRVRDGLDPQYVYPIVTKPDVEDNDTEKLAIFLDNANNNAGGCPLN
jgi:hypothetical protein